MKKFRVIFLIVVMSFLISPYGIDAANSYMSVGSDLNLYQCTQFQDDIISTNEDVYFGHCMEAVCEGYTYNISYYSPNEVNCLNGNDRPYYKMYKNGCKDYQSYVCNNGDIRYCTAIMYYDCSRTESGNPYVIPTKPTQSTSGYYSKTVEQTTIAPSNTKLKSLSFSNGKIDFEPETYEYNMTVDSIVSSISVNAVPEDENSKIDIVGNKEIKDGSEIVITVTGTDSTKSVYKVSIKKKEVEPISNNTKLKSLKVRDYSIGPFSVRTTTYNLTVDEGVTSIKVDAVAEDSTSVVMISGADNLKNGSKVTISVTAQDGSVGYYYINVNVKQKSNFIKILFIIVLILSLVAGGFYIYKKVMASKEGEKYEYE